MADYSANYQMPDTLGRELVLTERFPHPIISVQLAALEAAAIIAVAAGSQAFYTIAFWGQPANLDVAFGLGLVVAALYVLIAHARGLYRSPRILASRAALPDVTTSWFTAVLIAAMSAFLLKIGDQFSRAVAIATCGGGLATLTAARILTASAVKSGIRLGTLPPRRAIVFFDPVTGPDELLAALARQGHRVMRCLPLRDAAGRPETDLPEKISDLVRSEQVDEVFVTSPIPNAEGFDALMAQLRRLPIGVRFVAPPEMRPLLQKPILDCGPLKTFELQRPALRSHERAVKRALDITGALIALACLWPVLAMVALAIKLDSRGPVIFAQDRTGSNGRIFRIFKFRSMRTLDNGPVVRQARRGDPRITAVGRWIRSTSLDELPQFINVLKGDMSLVGPRPHVLAHDSQYSALIADYALRHHAKPGITGFAQVSGLRGETETPELMARRVEADLWYIANWSLWLDIKILFRTVGVITNISKVY
ncbi:undecaprenyl-phosphate glucose phosphotransferase [Bosea caraganae]|uniref:Undecaprenyl-phosphate glucose phosphotransferase n=1 Tax=Bosea caraganae TaxID=2763117 RepID=A0A370L574_9HYPH|nr:exopolysaccharide biosynthesis polyprenyl glycosylphosphotransferase [Bosea caraganae]RDJ24089.1 undecaprenyl-phosphate glucose phosphotransferase [Bosea caraganae]RDJ30131.1 undecaprenyl-phosphate glucose phosphotransferase [Bosea caraganae]